MTLKSMITTWIIPTIY